LGPSDSFPEEYRFLCLLVLKLAACARLNGCFLGIFHQDFIVLAFSNCKGALFLGALPSIQLENQNRAIFPFPGVTKIEA
jgi:hypothetical protein